ncbi:quinolinate synthase NadA [Sphingobacterium spiritivorum]|uniref:Quinolinate synthase n=1 Tax=Sphingobacterium spiritivorum ATCC 33861 TaxID=525373 RepID=D7VIW5_SPHSI|nr:quinolinate synthase NadA [Sphingobacterium spiritivorum]EFK60017.1 quinolinate synthetase complex, A subunit [Sphingobacterium spiritivorum ATCC 33861]QQT37357.1 quinolinate synthase NadA [Sphingobacterium spiritivorum]WQD34147.1 quinolinate synthase NadA [Sphingobacterium spiritivorum]SUJ29878.1 Quinolinate synthase A [Sphingobacterium spiritivorum]
MNITYERDLEAKGYIDVAIDPTIDLVEEINRLKKEKNAVILAHYYQESEIQDIADYIGDSLGLSQQAAKTDADVIVFAGVHFMAETAKILSPSKKVLLPDLKAGCSLSDSCPPHLFAKFKEKYPDHLVITYVNCTAELKALSDIVCTSSNAVQIVESLPLDQKIIFGPDRNLGAYVKKKTGRDLILWNGACMVHEIFSQDKIDALRIEYPDAKFIAHPECEDHILAGADYVGSTSGMLKFTMNDPSQVYIVATESGIIHQMQKASLEKTFIPAPPNNACACNDCPHMKLNTLEKLYNCLKFESPEITLPEDVILRAQKPIERMLEISERLGL